MHPIALPMVLGVDDWLAEELPEVRRFDAAPHGSLVLCDVAEDREWEFTGDDVFGGLVGPGMRIPTQFENDLTI